MAHIFVFQWIWKVNEPPQIKKVEQSTLGSKDTDPDDPKHVQAAKTYFEIEGSVKPAKMQVEVSGSAKELTDEQLQALIAQKSADELAARRARETG